MKRFDYESVKSRLVNRAKMDVDSATLLDDSAFSMIMDVFSEGISEIARYIEYNTNEKKWTNAQNLTSLTHMGKLIGRKRRRPTSAIGYVLVSHTDINKVPRLNYYGQNFFDVDQSSDYDDIIPKPNTQYNYIQRSALVPWTCPDVYTVPKGTVFHTVNNIQFISTESVSIRVLSTPFSSIVASPSKYETFLAGGGWDGIKYLKVPVIQGIPREATLGKTNGERFQTFALDAGNVEGAYNSISKNYFYVEITPPGSNSKPEKWAEIQNIRLAGPYDKVYETTLSEDGNTIYIKFGDGISGYKPLFDSNVEVHYLETAGAAGNVDQAGQILDDVAFPMGYPKIDPRTNQNYEFLNCTNTVSISGGRDAEDYSEYKLKAPLSYLQSYTTAVKAAYEEQIMNISPVLLSKLKCFPNSSFHATQADTTFDQDVNDLVSNEVSVISNALNVTAIKADGSKFDPSTVEEEFIQPIIKTIGDIKGPNDTLTYVEPNFIKVAPSLKINTYDLNTSDSDVYNQTAAAIAAKYSIFNTDFRRAFYSSDISHQASLLGFTDSVNTQIEVLASVSYDDKDIRLLNFSSQDSGISFKRTDWKRKEIGTLLAIPFQFDKIFASNKYKQGFKNYTVNSQYLLKANLRFINNASKETSSRTFFLYDNRVDSANVPTLQDVKLKDKLGNDIDISETLPNMGAYLGVDKLTFADETKDNFNDRQVRVAQFNYITNITDDEFMSKAKSWKTQPYENRPYEVDNDGTRKRFNKSDVADKTLIAEIGKNSKVCYKYNADWIPYVDIIFNENYSDPLSTQYAMGYFIIPLEYLGLNNAIVTESTSDMYISLSSLLKQFIELKIFAIPKQEDIEPTDWKDIVFIDDDDIKVERNLKYQK